MSNYHDLTNQKFGHLLVIRKGEGQYTKGGQYKTTWVCKCDCGNETIVQATHLKTGHTTSCGCHHKKVLKQNYESFRKPHRDTRLYKIWCDIKDRCYNPRRNKNSKYYFDKGIKMCDEWCNDFLAFYEWAMSHGYKDNLTIDRINFNGNYSPENCRWITNREQQRNKSTNLMITYQGETKCLTEWAELLNFNYRKVRDRIQKWNWDIERAFTTP